MSKVHDKILTKAYDWLLDTFTNEYSRQWPSTDELWLKYPSKEIGLVRHEFDKLVAEVKKEEADFDLAQANKIQK